MFQGINFENELRFDNDGHEFAATFFYDTQCICYLIVIAHVLVYLCCTIRCTDNLISISTLNFTTF